MGLVTKLQTNTVIQPSISFILKSAVLPIKSNRRRTLKALNGKVKLEGHLQPGRGQQKQNRRRSGLK